MGLDLKHREKIAVRCQAPATDMAGSSDRLAIKQGGTNDTDTATDRRLQPRRLAVSAGIVQPGRSRPAGARGRRHLRHQAAGGLAREERCAAHRLCRPSLQRGVWAARRPSTHDRSGRADLRREGLHAPVQINAKSAFTGDVWQWHQDYGTWNRDDGMPEPRAMNIAIFLDEVMPINGPLMLVPKSQTAGDLKASHDLATTSYPLWTLDEETVTRLVKEGGIVAPTGKAGGMLMFHGNLVHGSAGNITPYPRKIVYLTLNAVSNYTRNPTRPEYIAPRDFAPIQTVEAAALLRLARSHRQAAE